MSEIRINNIPTTAASTASDDFFAIDGSTNNTRKLSAYSPTFGGNLVVNGSVVSGSGTSSFAGTATISGTASSDLLSYNLLLGGVKRLILGYDTTNDYGLIASVHTGQAWKPLVINPIGGNVLIGTAIDGGQKFQVSGAAAISGNIILSTNNAYLQTKTSGGSLVSLMALTTDNITRFINGVDAGGFQWTNQAQTVAWASLTSSLLSVNGNLTVSGTGNSSVAGNLGIGETSPVVPLHVKTTGTGTGDFDNAIATLRSTAAGRTITLQFSDTTNQSYISSKSGALNFGVGGATLGMSLSSGGNLTVSGTGNNVFRGTIRWGNTSYPGFNGYITETNTASQLIPAITRNLIGTTGNTQYTIANAELGAYAAFELGADIRWFAGSGTFTTGQTITPTELMRLTQGGNVLIGTTTDSGNGKLQLATHSTSAGGIGFGTDVSLYRSGADQLTSNSSGTANNFFLRHSTTAAGGFQVQIDSSKDVYLFQRENRLMYIGTNNTTALTLDSSQNATFAKDIFLGTSGPSVKSTLSSRAPRQGLVGDGSQALTSIANLPAFGTGAWTVSAWVNITANKNYNGIFGSAAGGLWVFTSSTGALYAGKRGSFYNFGTFVDLGKTTLLTITNDGTTATVYKNGVSFGTSTTADIIANYTAAITGLGTSSETGSDAINGTISPLIYNRALSAAEVVALYEAGAPSASDYASGGANNTSYITGANSTFSSDTGFWTKAFSASIGSGQCTLPSGGGVIYVTGILVKGTKYRLSVNIITNDTSGLYVQNMYDIGYGFISGTGVKTFEFTASGSGAANFGLQNQAGVASIVIDDVTLVPIGLLLAPDAAQAGGGLVWYDTSGNAANITLPASGVSWNVPSSRVLGGAWTVQGNLSVNANQVLQTATSDTIYVYNQIRTSLSTGGGLFGVEGNAAGSLISGTNAYATVVSSTSSGTDLQFGTSGVVRATIGKTTGNLLIGTTTDSGNGKLQLATHTTSAGGIGFGTDVSVYRSGTRELTFLGASSSTFVFAGTALGATTTIKLGDGTNNDQGIIESQGGALVFKRNAFTALTLDSSQNATFAKDILLGTSGPSVNSTLSARAPRQGLVFDSSAHGGAPIANQPAFGTSDFTVTAWVNPVAVASNVYILASVADSASLFFTGTTVQWIANASAVISVSGGVVANKSQLFVVTRSAGTTTYYYNGVAVSTTSSGSGNLANPIVKMGGSASGGSGHFNGTISALIYNRALSASEVVALYEAGAPAGADYNSASNTSLITGDNSTFASDTGYWTKSSATISGGNLNLSSDGSSIFRANLLVIGKKYRYVTSVSANTTSVLIGSGSGAGYGTVTTTGTITGEFTATSTTFVIYQSGAGAATVGDITLFSLGLLLAPDAAQAGGGLVWYDTSGNAANITLPASGVSWNVPSSRVLGGNWTTSGTLGVNKVAGGEASVASTLQITSPAVSETGAGGLEWKADVANNGYGFRTLPVFNGVSSYDLYTQSRSNSASWTTRMSLTNSGNLLIGTTTDGGQKLQVNGTIRSGSGSGETLSAGSIDVGADIGIASTQGIVQGGARIVTFTSGNATFAGKVGIGVSPASWELNLQQSAVNSAVRIISPTALGLNDSSIYISWASGSKALIAASYESTGSYRPLVLSAGGVDSLTLDTNGNATFVGGIIGMTQGNVDNISDDGVASFTPLYNRGFIVINNPDYSQNALIAYFKAGSSYLLYSITKSADVTLNNSTTLTGTTGTDGKLNIGYNNSIIYIENRLGGIANFQRYALGGTN